MVLFLSLSVCLSVCLCVCVCVCLSVQVRRSLKARDSTKYAQRVDAQEARRARLAENQLPEEELADAFEDPDSDEE
jgi:DsbC/DsbD-like thiol-disulfide interchange protein